MADFTTAADLKIGALDRAGELTDGNSDYDAIALQQMNQLYRAVVAGGNEFDITFGDPWEWAKAPEPGILTLLPPFETGTASVTAASTSVTLSTAPTGLGSLVGWFFRINNRDTIYKVSAHTADSTSLTLDQAYLEATGATLSFKLIKLDYKLATGIERLIAPMVCFKRMAAEDSVGRISASDLSALAEQYPLMNIQSGIPERFAEIQNLDGIITVRFSRYPLEKLRVEYDYIPHVADMRIATFLDAAVNTGTETITVTDHGFVNNSLVQFTSTGTLPTGLTANRSYYVVEAAANTFKVSESFGGAAVNITAAAGGGTHKVSSVPIIPKAYRRALMYAAAHFILVDKSDSRSDYYYRQTQAMLQAMLSAWRKAKRHTSRDRGKLLARGDMARKPFVKGPRVFDDDY